MKRKSAKTSFLNRPRRHQKRALIGVKNQLRTFAPYFDGRFYTYDVLHEHTSWADIYFTSRANPHLFYNATIDTAPYAAKEHAERLAWDEAQTAYESHFPQHVGCFYDHAPGFHSEGHPDFKAFFKPSLYRWLDACTEQLLEQGKVHVFEGCKVLPNYRFGIGLQMVVDAPFLTPQVIYKAIDDFFDAQERSYQKSTALIIDPKQATQSSSINALRSDPSVWAQPFAQELSSQKEAQQLELVLPSEHDCASNPLSPVQSLRL